MQVKIAIASTQTNARTNNSQISFSDRTTMANTISSCPIDCPVIIPATRVRTRPPLTQGARNCVVYNCASAIAIWLISLNMLVGLKHF
ncbi:hypothetical protein [Nostoc sp.]|uniref:hypothetical protein n=1 Tax=Nostoc sp. TaxID=1180 RepID=UPI002FFB9B9A